MKGLYSLGMACVLLVTGLQAAEMNVTNDLLTRRHHRHHCHERRHHCHERCPKRCLDPCDLRDGTSYISVYTPSTAPQVIEDTGTATPIDFTNVLSGPVGIGLTPALPPSNTFEIECPGVYLIGWTLTATSTGPGLVHVSLRDLTTGLIIPPDPNATFSQGGTESASGQTIVTFLEKGHLIQLIVTVDSETTDVTITNPTLFITQIAELPHVDGGFSQCNTDGPVL